MNLPVKSMAPSLLMDPDSFNHMQRVASMLALSPLFPDHLRKSTKEIAIANGVLVLNMAARLNEDPLTVAQNIYFVSGKPGWSSSYMIGKANQHGVFKNPISWEVSGKGDDLSVTAFAELAATGHRVQITCDMNMAKAEGWTKNSKYTSMPEQMLRYRSATFLIRLYCPEVMVGVPSQVEIELGMKDVTPTDYAQATAAKQTQTAPEPEDAVIVEEEPKPEPSEPATEQEQTVETKEPEDEASQTVEKEPAETQAEPKKRDMEALTQTFNTIKSDLEDMEPELIGEVKDFYKEQMDELERDAPDLHKELIDIISAADKS